MKGINPTKAGVCFSYDQETKETLLSFHYSETALTFRLVEDVLYLFDWGDETFDVFQGQCLRDLLISYEVPLEDFKSDFVGKGLTLSSLTDTFSIKLDNNCIRSVV